MAEVALGLGGAALEEGRAAHFHLHQLGLGRLGLSKHTWGERTPSSCFSSSCSHPSSHPAPRSCSSRRGRSEEGPVLSCPHRALPSPWASPLPVQGSRRVASGHGSRDPERQAPPRRGEAGRGAPGSRPTGRPLSSQARPRVSSEGGNAGHVPGGHTGPFVPCTQEKTTPLPFAPKPLHVPTRPPGPILVRSSPFMLLSSTSRNIAHTRGTPSWESSSIEGSEALPGVKTRPGSGQG